MTYSESLRYLHGFVNFERTPPGRAAFTLDRVRELAARFGNPQLGVPVLHVAGTKGKGSTCAFAEAILRAAGLKTGLYTSPHLQDVRERFRICGKMIGKAAFARLVARCKPAIEELRGDNERAPTYFEILTLLAFAWFAEQKVDVAVIEVGLGGRLDATNICSPAACAITNISLDHQAILGNSLEKIAREKAGILKPGVPVVIAPQTAAVRAALERCADAAGARVVNRKSKIENRKMKWALPRARVRLEDGTEYTAELGLRGRHQVENWAVAVQLADLFFRRSRGRPLPAAAVRAGSRDVVWPGRLEEIVAGGSPLCRAGPRIFLDGAHNDHSLRTVIRELKTGLRCRPLILLFGCARDKDSRAMLKAIVKCGARNIIFTSSSSTRSKDPRELAREWQALTGRVAPAAAECGEGLRIAAQLAGGNGVVLVTGSLYLVGAARDEFRLA